MPILRRPSLSAALPLTAALLLAACGERPEPPRLAAEPGVLLVATEPGDAQLFVDGRALGRTPAEPGAVLALELPEGSHTLEARKAIDEHREWYARREGLQVSDAPMPAITLELEQRLTPAGEALRATETARRQAREETLTARFVPNADGTVTDTATGLMWTRCSVGQSWTGERCSGEASKLSWTQAVRAAESAEVAGHDDWRLPSREELHALTYCSTGRRFALDRDGAGGSCEGDFKRPTILEAVFPDTPSLNYWSGTEHPLYSHSAWGVAFANGAIGAGSKTEYVAARLVRVPR